MVESNGLRSTTAAAPAAVGGFFRVPGLFVRLSSSSSSKGGVSSNAAGSVDPDSVWSPTSPLDFKRSPPRVCLGLADALAAAAETGSLHFGARSSFLDSIKPFLDLARPPKAAAACGGENKKAAAAAASSAGVAAATVDKANEYYDDDCEEYTCVISRGANPRTTHIRAGETVEVVRTRDVGGGGGCRKVIFSIEPLSGQQPSSSPAAARSGRCCCCMKRLPEDRDIFMYLGEKAFCSNECRNGYIEEEIEEAEELMIPDPALNL